MFVSSKINIESVVKGSIDFSFTKVIIRRLIKVNGWSSFCFMIEMI